MGRFSFLLILSLSLPSCALFSPSKEAKAATGPTYSSSAPTKNISLKDNTDEEIRSYYSSLSSLSASELQGQNLLKNLRSIIHDFTYYSYDTVWKIYEITDREWSLSPANGDGYATYDSANNQYTSYSYGSNSSPKNNPWIHTLYRNRDESGVTIEDGRIREWVYGSHTSDTIHSQTGGTNKEHVWCQSRGFKASSGAEGPAGTDIHHLISGDGYVNGTTHNNYPYGFVKNVTIDDSKYSYIKGNYAGSAVNASAIDESTVVFEPQDSDKGDIARACFYMAACYNNLSGNETITQFDPDLALCDYATSSAKSEISSEKGSAVGMGILRDLLVWHKLDPVDEYEIHRNNLIYNNYQFNRNPFIDFPEWADYIWGTAEMEESTKKVTYDATPTGSANPNEDVINGYRDTGSEEETEGDNSSWTYACALNDGDEVAFVHEGSGGTIGGFYDGNSSKYASLSASLSLADKVASTNPGYSFTVEGGSGQFRFRYGEDQYLSYGGSSTQLVLSSTQDDKSLWNVSFASESGWTFQNVYAPTRYIGYNMPNNSYPRFASYTNLTAYPSPSLYVKGLANAAEAYARRFINEFTKGCNNAGTYDDTKMDWSEAAAVFNLLSTQVRAYFKGTKTLSSTSVQAALARYDYIVGKYGTLLFPDFMERNPSSLSGAGALPSSSLQGTSMVLMLILSSSLIIASYFIVSGIRKRKEKDK